jgi:hypothetical protein
MERYPYDPYRSAESHWCASHEKTIAARNDFKVARRVNKRRDHRGSHALASCYGFFFFVVVVVVFFFFTTPLRFAVYS